MKWNEIYENLFENIGNFFLCLIYVDLNKALKSFFFGEGGGAMRVVVKVFAQL